MRREELQKILLEKGVSKSAFSFDGIQHEDALCLIHREGTDWEWELVYNNHGKIVKIGLFAEDFYAHNYIYLFMKKKYGFE